MKRLFPFVLALLLCVGCTAQPKTETPEPDEPRLDERFGVENADCPGTGIIEVITDFETSRKYLFYKLGNSGGLTELSQSEPTDPEPVRYELTDAERALVCEVVMAESGNQPYCGQVAVAQCLLNDCERSGIRPAEAVVEYQYTTNRVSPSESVCEAVSAVFDRGEVAVDDTILWFYAPAHVDGTPWHESQRHVLTINDHKFFAERGDADADH